MGKRAVRKWLVTGQWGASPRPDFVLETSSEVFQPCDIESFACVSAMLQQGTGERILFEGSCPVARDGNVSFASRAPQRLERFENTLAFVGGAKDREPSIVIDGGRQVTRQHAFELHEACASPMEAWFGPGKGLTAVFLGCLDRGIAPADAAGIAVSVQAVSRGDEPGIAGVGEYWKWKAEVLESFLRLGVVSINTRTRTPLAGPNFAIASRILPKKLSALGRRIAGSFLLEDDPFGRFLDVWATPESLAVVGREPVTAHERLEATALYDGLEPLLVDLRHLLRQPSSIHSHADFARKVMKARGLA